MGRPRDPTWLAAAPLTPAAFFDSVAPGQRRRTNPMTRRDAIHMSRDECDQFLQHAQTIVLSTIDQRGYPHSVAMWYVMEAGCALMTTYAKSQKALNIRRNPKVALMAESGGTYDTLKGVLIRGRAELINDIDACVRTLMLIQQKMTGAIPEGIEDALRRHAQKRVLVRVIPEHVSSWDHTKLSGAY
jgi:PPOX class probable F420-dependent enzyme